MDEKPGEPLQHKLWGGEFSVNQSVTSLLGPHSRHRLARSKITRDGASRLSKNLPFYR
jgi:hypothetical protein